MSHFLPFSGYSQLPGYTFEAAVMANAKVNIEDMKVIDLILNSYSDIRIYNGVYLFFDDSNQCLYAGKNSAMSFVERIPWHMSLASGAWMNHLLTKLQAHHHDQDIITSCYRALECSLLLIPVDVPGYIIALEKYCRLFLNPQLNSYKPAYQARYSHVDRTQRMSAILRNL